QRWLIDGRPPRLVTASMVRQDEWLGYFIAPPPGSDPEEVDPAQLTLEFRLRRTVGEGMREEVLVTNYTLSSIAFDLVLNVDADFKDWTEGKRERRYRPVLARRHDQERRELAIQGSAEHAVQESESCVIRSVRRILVVRLESSNRHPELADG